MIETTTIEPATPEDVESIASIKAAREDEVYRNYGTKDEHQRGLKEYCSPDYVEALLNDQHTSVLVARVNGRVVAVGAATDYGDYTWIHALFANASRLSLGSQVLLRLIEQSIEAGKRTIECEVFEANGQTRGYFENLGFRAVGWRESATYRGQKLIRLSAEAREVLRRLETHLRLRADPSQPPRL